jgi:dTMP kinase
MTARRARGAFITFEGGEGCGKSTQLKILDDYLETRGFDVEVTREPGGTPLAESIREILLDPVNETLCPVTELLLYEAARAQHVSERILPALEAGRIVLSDRFYDSTTAYQGAGRGLGIKEMIHMHEIATGGLTPDLTIVIDVPADLGLARATQGGSDRIEREKIEFHERVRTEFLRLAQAEPDRIRVVDGTKSIDEVAAAIREIVDLVLKEDRGIQSSRVRSPSG